MGGCFRQSANKELVYVQLINKIVAQATKPANLQFHEGQIERIHKKGDVKKLIDHLSSHKHNIHQSMLYLCKLLQQPRNNLAVLVIIDELVKNMNNFTSEQFKKPKSKKKQAMDKINAGNSREIEVSFEMMYFPTVLAIFDSDSNLKASVLESIRKYAAVRKQRFTCEKLISQVYSRLLILIQSDYLVSQSVATYSSLITKSNTYLAQNQTNHEALFLLLNLWINFKDPQVQYHVATVIHLYISRCMQSRQYLELFTVIFSIYDVYHFRQASVSNLETKVLLLLQEQELRQQFLKGLFRYLLMYLCMSEDLRVKQSWEKVIFTTSYDLLKGRHQNILSAECKINGYNTLIRWIGHQFIDINQVVSFSRLSLYSCFRFNIMSQNNQQLLTKVLTTFVQVYNQCNDSSKFLITQMLIEDIHYTDSIPMNQLQSLIWLARKFISEGPILEDEEAPKFLRSLECKPEQRSKLKEIVLMYALLLGKYKQPYNYTILECLCQAAYSFYEILDIPESTVRQKYQMAQAIVYFMRKLSERGYNDFVLLWINGMPKSKKPNAITRYFDKLIVLEIWEMLTATRRVPDEMIHLNTLIENMSNSDIVGEIWIYQKAHPELKISSRLSPIQHQNQVNRRYEFIKDNFSKLFKKDRITDLSQRSSFERPLQQLHHRSSAVASEHSYKTDESFQEVYGMIVSKNPQQSSHKSAKPVY